MSNEELVIADTGTLSIYCFIKTGEGAAELADARKSQQESIEQMEGLIKKQADDEYWKKQLEYYRNQKYEIMTYADFLAAERRKMLSGPLTRITEEKYWDALEVLPPLN